MSYYPRAHARGCWQGRSRPSLPPWGRAYGRTTMNPIWVHEGGEMVEEDAHMVNQLTGWENYNMAHSSSYSNAPVTYTQQSSSTSSFPNPHSQFGLYMNLPQQQPQFTFTPTNVSSNIRGHTLQQEQITQGYQPSTVRGLPSRLPHIHSSAHPTYHLQVTRSALS